MTKYFELLLDLLDINNKDDYLKIAKIIEDNQWKNFEIYHQYAPIFTWYINLLDETITLENFLRIWDINSDILYSPDRCDSISFLKNNISFLILVEFRVIIGSLFCFDNLTNDNKDNNIKIKPK